MYLLQLEALSQALKDWKSIVYGKEVRVITDSALLKHALSYTGDDVEINKLLMKLGAFKLKVEVKPESFRALKLSKLLISEHHY